MLQEEVSLLNQRQVLFQSLQLCPPLSPLFAPQVAVFLLDNCIVKHRYIILFLFKIFGMVD